MNQENNKYLSELFLNILGEDYSEKSVEKAVRQCNTVFCTAGNY